MNKPAPTTAGEWTADTVMQLFLSADGGQGRASEGYKSVSDAHNACLAKAKAVLGAERKPSVEHAFEFACALALDAIATEQEAHAKTSKQFVDMKAYADATEIKLGNAVVQLDRLERVARDTIGADGALIMACDNARNLLTKLQSAHSQPAEKSDPSELPESIPRTHSPEDGPHGADPSR